MGLGTPMVETPRTVAQGVRQLFIDDELVETAENVRRVVNQPTKYAKNPVLVPDQVWEHQEGLIYPTGSVMYDAEERLFKMWYQIANYSWGELMLAYATSENGIDWNKPDTGFMYSLARRMGATNTNIVLRSGGGAFDWPIVWKDPHERDASKRYKLVFADPYASIYGIGAARHGAGGGSQMFGMSVGFSGDGLHWDLYPGNPVLSFEGENVNALLREPGSQRYVCFIRLYANPAHPHSPTLHHVGGVRVIGRTESEDFRHWTTPNVCLAWDPYDPELNRHIYNMEVMEYEKLYVGFLSMYHVTGVPDRFRQDGVEFAQKLPDDIPGLDTVDIQLAVSRDTYSWRKVGNESWTHVGGPGTFIPLGEEGEFDSAMLYVLQSPVMVGDEIWIYYAGMADKHWSTRRGEPQRGAIGLAKLKRDRFVSMENQNGTPGKLTTKLLSLGGGHLVVNCDSSSGGLDVEVLDAEGNLLKGFSRDVCVTIRDDATSAPVRWDTATIDNASGRPIRLRFHLDAAKLYSFALEE